MSDNLRLHIAGGCGEHGRNCFHVMGEHTDFIVDCGIRNDSNGGYPHLGREEIPHIQAAFLTHSHADHTGALEWLHENGFRGAVIASRHTLDQIPFKPPKSMALEDICAPLTPKEVLGMKITWGKSGHCLGSVWYQFEAEAATVFFSGDYTEDSPIYRTDLIRRKEADLAVLDCAYGRQEQSYEALTKCIVTQTAELLEKYSTVAMTVPKYGRGLDLFYLLRRSGITADFFGDEHFVKQVAEMKRFPEWYLEDGSAMSEEIRLYTGTETGIVFISDPQLKSAPARKKLHTIMAAGGTSIMTGTVDAGSYSEELIGKGNMIVCRYPVHLHYGQYQKLLEENTFKKSIPYHTAELIPAAMTERIL